MTDTTWLQRFFAPLSYFGVALATLFFAASLTPSLLPRNHLVQGLLGGFALAVGYAWGVFFRWLWSYLELPLLAAAHQRWAGRATALAATLLALVCLWRATVWQNSLRGLMEMPPLASVYPASVALIGLASGAILLAAGRLLGECFRQVNQRVHRVLPRRLANFTSAFVVALLLLVTVNQLVVRQALWAADRVFENLDAMVDEGIVQPADARASGSPTSRIDWDTIGRRGKNFIVDGPTEKQLRSVTGENAQRPLRVYVGLRSAETTDARAQLALRELQRVGGFERSVLVIATPTGTGWLDPGAVDTLEYLHRGDTAIVTLQYSYLPSWITILVNPEGSRDAALALFYKVYDHWRQLPVDARPRLYLHGLSLGAFGSELCADLFTLFEHPIQGGVWSGPPFPSVKWAAATRARNPDSPAWLPRFRDGSMLRFTGRENALPEAGPRWGPMRFVYMQHASDPMVFFSPELLYQRPSWLNHPRGPDVSPYLRWTPVVTFLQVAFDLPMSTSVPHGYGHNYAAASYIDAWVAVTEPEGWTPDALARLKAQFAD